MKSMLSACCLLLAVHLAPAQAEPASLHAGIARLTVSEGAVPAETLVWYPTTAPEVAWQAGPFSVPASRNASIAEGEFPLILLSHGGGVTGGSPWLLRELSAALARQGFVVIAPLHGKAPLAARPAQVKAALQTVLADARFQSHVSSTRLGMIGFSLGGAVALELAGAQPDFAHFQAYCEANRSDAMSCDNAPRPSGSNTVAAATIPAAATAPVGTVPPRSPPLALQALVLLDPFAVLFQHDGLLQVNLPVLLLRPQQSRLGGAGNALALRSALPHAPEFSEIAGSHFVFTDVCSAELKASAPEICEDPPGLDRAALHRQIETQIGTFFKENL